MINNKLFFSLVLLTSVCTAARSIDSVLATLAECPAEQSAEQPSQDHSSLTKPGELEEIPETDQDFLSLDRLLKDEKAQAFYTSLTQDEQEHFKTALDEVRSVVARAITDVAQVFERHKELTEKYKVFTQSKNCRLSCNLGIYAD